MMARVEDRTPYTVVAFQECERMNMLTSEMKTSLKMLDLGLKVITLNPLIRALNLTRVIESHRLSCNIVNVCMLCQQGELTITSDMEELSNALYLDTVPESWTKRAYPSMAGLAAWFADLLLRIKELEQWTSDFILPNVVWLSGFFNPQSFLTAIEQSTARKNEWPLDKMALQVDVTKKNKEDFNSPPREGI